MQTSFGLFNGRRYIIVMLAIAAVGFMESNCVFSLKQRSRHSAERRLYDFLFRHYDPGCRPVVIAMTPINVSVSLSLIQIMDLVEKNQTLITQVWIEEEWIDETLRWIPEDFGDLTSLVIPSMSIWLPDIYIFNNADRGDEGFVALNESRVTVGHDGHVRWIVPLIVHSACAVDVTYFPFDEQKCFVRFGSWIYDEKQVNLSLKATAVQLDSYSINTELSLLEATITRIPAADETESAINKLARGPHLKVQLGIRRKPLYYMYTIVAPTLVLCALNLFSFLLPCDNGNKVGIGLTVFLSLYVLQLAIAKNIPESNTLPIIGVFLTLVMTLNAVSLVCATLIINVKKAADMTYCPSLPRPLVAFCRSVLGPITCTSFNDAHYTSGPPHHITPCRQSTADGCDNDASNHLKPWKATMMTTSTKNALTKRTLLSADTAGLSGPRLVVNSKSTSSFSNNCLTNNSELQLSRSQLTSSSALDIADTPSDDVPNSCDGLALKSHQTPAQDSRRPRDVDVDFRSCRPQRTRRLRHSSNALRHSTDAAVQSDFNSFELKTYADRTSLDELKTSCYIRKTSMTSPTPLARREYKCRSSAWTMTSEKELNMSRQEWCFLAESLDRMMFGLFLTAMLSTTIVSLVIVPESQKWNNSAN